MNRKYSVEDGLQGQVYYERPCVGRLLKNDLKIAWHFLEYWRRHWHVEVTFIESAVGCRTTLPSSLSSNARIEATSVYSLTLTLGRGCVVVKSPCVSHLYETKAQTPVNYFIIYLIEVVCISENGRTITLKCVTNVIK